jgi:hypothetical protein
MASVYTKVLTSEELEYLNALPEVLAAKASLDTRSSGMVKFTVPITPGIRETLQARFGLDVTGDIPMRWIKGDTAPHIDRGASAFEQTFLVYLNDSPGELMIDAQSYPIEANTGFSFTEGLSHETQGTSDVPRLLLGPMNEFAEPVGAGPGIYYFSTQADADQADPGISIAYGGYPVFTVGTYVSGSPTSTSWRVSTNSVGPSPTNIVYANGSTLDGDGDTAYYYLYPANPCFLEGSMILCQVEGAETYVPVEKLTKGTLVKTSLHGYKPLVLLGKGSMQNPGTDDRTENRLYKCSPSKYPELTHDLFLTGSHSILVPTLTDKEREETIQHLGKVFVTDKKYRLIACVDERAEPWASEGTYTIWHFALEHENERMNYGVYANGLLVETCCIKTLKNKSNMTVS